MALRMKNFFSSSIASANRENLSKSPRPCRSGTRCANRAEANPEILIARSALQDGAQCRPNDGTSVGHAHPVMEEFALEVGPFLLGAFAAATGAQISVDRLGDGVGPVPGIGSHGMNLSTAPPPAGTGTAVRGECETAGRRTPSITMIGECACRPFSVLNRRPRVSCCAVSPEVLGTFGLG